MQNTLVPSLVGEDSPGEGNDNPLKNSRLENSMDRGAWQAAVHGGRKVRHDLATKQQQFRDLEASDHWILVLSLAQVKATCAVSWGGKKFLCRAWAEAQTIWRMSHLPTQFPFGFMAAKTFPKATKDIDLDCWAKRKAQLCETHPRPKLPQTQRLGRV